MYEDIGASVRCCFDEVAGGFDLQSGDFGERGDDLVAVSCRGVDAGSNGCSTQVDFEESISGHAEDSLFFGEVVGEGLEFLTEGHGHGVLKLGSSHFENIDEFGAFGVEG